MVEMKTPGEVDAIRAAGRVVAGVLAAARACAAPGVKLQDLDDAAREVLAKAGATSPFLNYKPRFAPVPYPAVICTSVNDAALHGIPGKYRLQAGDLLSVDAGATLDGWVADAAISFSVGPPANGDAELIATTQAALEAGITAAVPGGRSATSRPRSPRSATRAATASRRSSAATASAGPCTRTRTSPTAAGPGAACG